MSEHEGFRRGSACAWLGFRGKGRSFSPWQLGFLVAALLLPAASPVHAQMALPGKFDVSDTGSASYTIPLSVVPGTAGVEPKISFSYDSRSGNGLLGVGWSLEGLPAVTRCAQTIVQDGARGGVNYDSDDRFCLEGERLVATSGTYGADGTEYRTEREGFSKIVSHGTAGSGPAWFEVWTKAGLILEFGNTADSRIEAEGKSEVRLWVVNKTSDTKGNYFTASYIEDNGNGEYRPDRIDYTGNAGASVAPYASVRFVYETRPDVVPFYQGGSLIKTTQRLTTVQTYNGEDLVREYRLAYDADGAGGRSRLTSLTLCDDGDTCLPATTIVSADGGSAFDIQSVYTQLNTGTGPNWVGDFNGDGKDDVASWVSTSTLRMHLSSGPGFSVEDWLVDLNSDSVNRNWLGDFNGDGRMDIAAWVSDTQVQMHLSTGTGFVTYSWTAQLSSTGSSFFDGNQIGDFNGDGRRDILSWIDGTSARIHLSAGNGFTVETWTVSFNTSGSTPLRTWHQLGDFNGDGLTDIAAWVDGSSLSIHLSTGSGFTVESWTAQLNASGDTPFYTWQRLGDFNGDGKTDIASWIDGTSVRIHLSTGEGFATETWTAQLNTSGSAPFPDWHQLADFNGDGKTDIAAWVSSTQLRMQVSTGSGFTTGEWTTELYGDGSTFGGWNWLGDFDGDGLADLAAWVSGGASLKVHTADGPFPDLVTSIANGVGAVTEIAQDTLSAGEPLYTKGSDVLACNYPCVDIQGPIYVVSEVQSANGILDAIGEPGRFVSTYRYAKARSDLSGRGFLGFARMTVRDEQSGIEQATTYRQDWPYLGLVLRRVKTLDTAELNRTRNDYAATDLGDGRTFPYLTQSTEWSWEPDGKALPATTTTYAYDTYGNTTQVEVSTHADDGRTRTTVNTYDNDTTNWLLGRLTRSEVTSADYTGSGAPVDEDDPDLEPSSIDVTIDTSVDNPDIAALAMAAGWDGFSPVNLEITIAQGVLVGSSSTSTAALSVNSFPEGSRAKLINLGSIIGRGGSGGAGGYPSNWGGNPVGGSGGTGGNALNLAVDVTIDNSAGEIFGAGGGGGGGGAYEGGGAYLIGGGGGTGAGSQGGATGGGGGQSGTITVQVGGSNDSDYETITVSSGNGGSGGTYAAGGGSGAAGGYSGGSGGGAGKAIVTNGYMVTWLGGDDGDVRGAVDCGGASSCQEYGDGGSSGGEPTPVPVDVVVTIASSVDNPDIAALAQAEGWDGTAPVDLVLRIREGVVVGSTSTSVAALSIGSFPEGSRAKLINLGSIIGRGGSGGAGGYPSNWGGNPVGGKWRHRWAMPSIWPLT